MASARLSKLWPSTFTLLAPNLLADLRQGVGIADLPGNEDEVAVERVGPQHRHVEAGRSQPALELADEPVGAAEAVVDLRLAALQGVAPFDELADEQG